MGSVLAKFRKEKSTEQILEALEEEIQQIEKYTINTQDQKRRFVFNFLTISIGIYVIAFLVFYFLYFPPTWKERVIYSIPLLLFPLVIILLRKLFTWYFQRKLNKNSKKLSELRDKKKIILEQVMDKETYKVALGLLQRFGDKIGPAKYALTTTPRIASSPGTNLNQTGKGITMSTLTQLSPLNMNLSATNSSTTLSKYQSGGNVANTSIRGNLSPQTPLAVSTFRRTPFPIVNQQNKSAFERVVDLLVGDGPQDRFGMICKKCYAHNGMALKEEFDYVTFRCAFCHSLNPSRKSRPAAPRLQTHPIGNFSIKKTSSESSSSDTESESKFKAPTIQVTAAESPTENLPDLNSEKLKEDLNIDEEKDEKTSETITETKKDK
ncbi:endoplasmic reticulum junction formation protein lunapark-B isoform X2 [Teleopsis dalmanni]|uniref:endoplasmic reticulum junction formation protein lunapark-B isoform X2 n=1 Tax=Teleopsis dalmanni TaxID=139649 RepID=UPI0018CCE45F|nr:endoplasmic reticulum junction formation protein lunapark-B isoform X2 [Teleopsis dalmanni]